MTQYKVTQGFTSTKPLIVVPNTPGRWTWQGAPSIIKSSATGGVFTNGANFTINGGPFFTKSGGAPTQWDHGQDGAGVLNAGYSGGWPNAFTAGLASCNIFNRAAPFQSGGSSTIQPPTPYTGVFVAGCHGDLVGSNQGYNVMLWNSYSTPTYPYYAVRNFYCQYDPNWWFTLWPSSITFLGDLTNGSNLITNITTAPFPVGLTAGDFNGSGLFNSGLSGTPQLTAVDPVLGTATLTNNAIATKIQTSITALFLDRDENTKVTDFNMDGGSNPYGSTEYYTANGPGAPKSNTATHSYATGQNPLQTPDQNGHGSSWGLSLNLANPALGVNNGWKKLEYVVCYTSATSGFYWYYENGVQVVNHFGSNAFAQASSAITVDAIGGYGRNQGYVGQKSLITPIVTTGANGAQTQWRYFANNYYDRQTSGAGRFYLTNTPTWAPGDGNPLYEIQPYVAWANASVTMTCNKGNLSSGAGYLWFIDEGNGVGTAVLQAVGTIA